MANELKELNLVDNFLFGAIMSDEKAAPVLGRAMLKAIFQRDFQDLKIRSEHVIWPGSEKLHGVRLDAYIEEDRAELVPGGSEIYNVEPDKKEKKKKNLPRRSRFYHSKIDAALLEAGKEYKDLPNVWVIFITNFDPFGEKCMIYTVKSHCVEKPEMPYEDGAVTLFLYTKGIEGNPSENLRKFLAYFEHTIPENAVTPELADIQKIVDQKKQDPKTKEAFMTLQEYIEDERMEAAEAEKQRADFEKQRADSAEQRADLEKQRADSAEQRADLEKQRADSAEQRADSAEQKVIAAYEENQRLKEEMEKLQSAIHK